MLATLLMGALMCAMNAAAETHNVTAYYESFAPLVLYIEPGDTVRWTNMIAYNTVAQDALLPDGAVGWRSRIDEDFEITLDIEGVYPYLCEPYIHVGMFGVIVVGEPINLDAALAHGRENFKGFYRRILDLLDEVKLDSGATIPKTGYGKDQRRIQRQDRQQFVP